MKIMRMTALDSATGCILDVTAMSDEQRDAVHGWRVCRTNGIHPVCRGCAGTVHLVVNHRGTVFWSHNPGQQRRCTLGDVAPHGESEEHYGTKLHLVETFRGLVGWHAEPERRFELRGEVVQADVFAWNEDPRTHQEPTLWEVQLARQTHGEFVHRTERAAYVAGHRTAWVTPQVAGLDCLLGILTDRSGLTVTDRVYTAPDMSTPLTPMPLRNFVSGVFRRRNTLQWVQVGGHGTPYIAYPRTAAGTTTVPAGRPRQWANDDLVDRVDCDRARRYAAPLILRPDDQPTRQRRYDAVCECVPWPPTPRSQR